MLVVRRGHNNIAVGVSVEVKFFRVLTPRHKLKRVFIEYVVLGGLDVGRIHVEANHAANKRVPNLLLPGLLRARERNFN